MMMPPSGSALLPHRLAEAVVVVGADQYSGLKLFAPPDDADEKSSTLSRQISRSLYDHAYQPLLTASLNEARAHFPDQVIFAPSGYPPAAFKRRSSFYRRHSKEGSSPLLNPNESAPRLSRRQSGQVSCVHNDDEIRSFVAWRRRNSVIRVKHQTVAGPDGTIKAETIQGIPPLLYPDGLKITQWTTGNSRPPTSVSYLSLTALNGDRLYSTTINWSRLFRVVRREEEGQLRVRGVEEEELEVERDEQQKGDDGEDEGPLIYVPCSILLISKYPYFTVMKQCLSALVRVLADRENCFESELMHFAACMTHTPVPSGGLFSIEVDVLDSLVIIPPPLPVVMTTVDFDLSILLKSFKPDILVSLLTALLTQQRLVLVADSLSQAVIACEGLLLFLRPFQWRFPFVPTLTTAMIDFLEAPGPYFFGCIAAHYLEDLRKVKNSAILYIANLNTGTLEIPEGADLPPAPSDPCLKLFTLLSRVHTDFPSFMLERPSLLSIEDQRQLQMRFDAFNNQMILLAFFEFMVDLFQDYKQMEQHDSLKIFLSGHADGRQFYEAVCRCEIFNDFVRSRRNSPQNDPFQHVERTMRVYQEGVKPKLTSGTFSRTRRRSSVALQTIEELRARPTGSGLHLAGIGEHQGQLDVNSFRLAAFNPTSHTNFLESNIQLIMQTIESTPSEEFKASLLRLKSELYLGLGEKLPALTDMLELSRKDIRLLCKGHARAVLQSLSQEEVETNAGLVTEMSKLVGLSLRNGSNLGPPVRMSDMPEMAELRPQQNLDCRLTHDEFAAFLRHFDITKDADSCYRLFQLFTKNASGPYVTVERAVVSSFYEGWKQVISSLMSATQADDEEIMKTSDVMRVDPEGSGNLTLTSEHLKLRIQSSASPPKPLFSFQLITKIEMKACSSMLRRRHILVVYNGKKELATLWFPTEREARTWEMLLRELWAGRYISADTRDRTLMEKALENVLLMDSCLQALQDAPPASHILPFNEEDVAAHLGELTQLHRSSEFLLDKDTAMLLQRKINPCSMDAERLSVDCLQAVPSGKRCGDHRVDLWTLCNEDANSLNRGGRLLIINAHSSAVEASVLCSAMLVCMVRVGPCMWVGDFYHTIYIIDINSRQVTRELVEHHTNDCIVALATTTDYSLVASGSGSGEVLVWNPTSWEVVHRWYCGGRSGVIDLRFAPDASTQLWCCLRRSILVYDAAKKECLHEFQLEKKAPFDALQCLEIDPQRRFVYAASKDTNHVLILNMEDATLHKVIETTPLCHKIADCPNCKPNRHCRRCSRKETCRGISRLLVVKGDLWVGCKDGNLSVVWEPEEQKVRRRLSGHSDALQSLCSDGKDFVFSGGRAKDGKIATWSTRQM